MPKWEYTCVSAPEQDASDDFGNLMELLNSARTAGRFFQSFSDLPELLGKAASAHLPSAA
jgi:hypothetical protein